MVRGAARVGGGPSAAKGSFGMGSSGLQASGQAAVPAGLASPGLAWNK